MNAEEEIIMMKEKNRCPFLKEQKVAFCKAFPLRKLLPFDRIYAEENICATRRYTQCPIYREKATREGPGKNCPFLEIETVIYCEVFPIKKMIPSSCYKLECPCTSEKYPQCPLYQKMVHGDLPVREEEAKKVWGFVLRSAYYYHRGHTWMEQKGEAVRVGLDDFGQFLVGPIKAVILPKIGERIRKEEPFMEIISDGGNVRLLSPLSGTITAVNQEVIEDPELVNLDPYERGWLLEVTPDEPVLQAEGVFHGQEAEGWLREESARLQRALGGEIGTTMADGGDLLRDLRQEIGTAKWRSLINTFLERKEG